MIICDLEEFGLRNIVFHLLNMESNKNKFKISENIYLKFMSQLTEDVNGIITDRFSLQSFNENEDFELYNYYYDVKNKITYNADLVTIYIMLTNYNDDIINLIKTEINNIEKEFSNNLTDKMYTINTQNNGVYVKIPYNKTINREFISNKKEYVFEKPASAKSIQWIFMPVKQDFLYKNSSINPNTAFNSILIDNSKCVKDGYKSHVGISEINQEHELNLIHVDLPKVYMFKLFDNIVNIKTEIKN